MTDGSQLFRWVAEESGLVRVDPVVTQIEVLRGDSGCVVTLFRGGAQVEMIRLPDDAARHLGRLLLAASV